MNENTLPNKESDLPLQNPLDPLPGESPEAYEAFLAYFELGADRSIEKAAREIGASVNTLEEWSPKYQWRKRLRAYRKLLAGKRLGADASAIERQATAKVGVEQIQQECSLALKKKLIQLAEELLNAKVATSAEDIKTRDILRMFVVGEQMGKSAALKASGIDADTDALRAQLLGAAEWVYQQKRAGRSVADSLAKSPTPEPPGNPTQSDPNSTPNPNQENQ